MFVWKMKLSPRLKTAAVIALLAVFTLLCVASAVGAHRERSGEQPAGASREDEQASRDCLTRIGAEQAELLESSRVTIPEEFDAVYEEYNALQKRVGLDLSESRGWEVLKSVYAVKNKKADYAVILAGNGRVIGGHLTDGEYGGEYLPLE